MKALRRTLRSLVRSAAHRVVCVAAVNLIVGAVASASATAAPFTVTDDRGVRTTFDMAPRRIVTLLPSLTESVCSLGACDRLVGTDRYSDWPASVRTLPKLGGLDDTQVERIVALRPDVVLAGTSVRVIERLEGLGIKVVLVDWQTHADVKRTLATIAQLLGTPAAADRVWSGIERDIAAAAARVPPSVRGQRVYFEVEPTPYAAGADSFIGETLTQLGMGNIVPAALGAFPRLNPEYVVRSAPDIVMASRRDLATMAGRPGWDHLAALEHARDCGFDEPHYEMLLRPGPRLGEAASTLADCLASVAARSAPVSPPSSSPLR